MDFHILYNDILDCSEKEFSITCATNFTYLADKYILLGTNDGYVLQYKFDDVLQSCALTKRRKVCAPSQAKPVLQIDCVLNGEKHILCFLVGKLDRYMFY